MKNLLGAKRLIALALAVPAFGGVGAVAATDHDGGASVQAGQRWGVWK